MVCSFRRTLVSAVIIAALGGCTATPAATTQGGATPTAATSRSPGGADTQLVVFAAASLNDAFTQIGTTFEAQHPGVQVAFSFAGSNQLRIQIEQGARADVFASANTAELNTLIRDGLAVSGTQRVFTRNRLAILVPKDNPGGVHSPHDLAKPGLKLVLANDKVPVGHYARQALGKFSADPSYGTTFSATVLANVVSNEEDVKQVVQKVQLGEADAGIAYVSDLTPSAAQQVTLIPIPDAYNVIATYPIAPLKDAPHAALAQAFVDAVLSPAGQQTLKKWGFQP